MRGRIERLRVRLAGQRGALALAAFGLVSGLLAGGVLLAFRATVETAHGALLPFRGADGFAALAYGQRLLFPLAGAVIAVLVMALLGRGRWRVGVVHVIERLAHNEGQLPLKNALLQFVGGAVVLIGGLSVGREGPAIHLGAASASLLGQWFRLPHNSLRTLVACGAAAAIAASFNTPLAGVAFAMEVVMMEYSIAGFTPVILAAVGGASMARIAYGDDPAFLVPQLALASLWELPYIVAMGVAMGAFAALYVVLMREFTRLARRRPWWQPLLAAGVLVGGCGLARPEVMGIGYDVVNRVLIGDYLLGTLAVIALLKLVATAISIGAGAPGGLIGPILVMGAAAGGVMGYLGQGVLPVATSHIGLYVMLGMAAMMGASLRAPLAALLALLELTGNPNIILPGMLAVVSASLASWELFHCESMFTVQMRELGLDYPNDPVVQQLRRIGVAAVMSRAFKVAPARLPAIDAAALLGETPQWIVVEKDTGKVLLPASDLARHLEAGAGDEVDLLDIPAQRRSLAAIHPEATLQEALAALEHSHVEALYVERPIAPLTMRVFGVLTREQIEASYRYQPPPPGTA
ncbi:MAG: chloride channel protein [Gammaproteobacteria bacterium]|nr:chloride channel protein [Gammaproteobacteria bacterium]